MNGKPTRNFRKIIALLSTLVLVGMPERSAFADFLWWRQHDPEIDPYVRDYIPLITYENSSRVTQSGAETPGAMIGKRRQYCSSDKMKGTTTFGDIIALDPTVGILWPGALIQGKTLGTGKLQDITEDRAPMTVTVSKVVKKTELSRDDFPLYSYTMKNPSFRQYQEAQQNLVNDPGTILSQPGFMQFDVEEVHTLEQAAMQLGFNLSWVGNSVSTSLSKASKTQANSLLIRFVQTYYTMSVATPQTPSDVFANSVRFDDHFRSQIYKSNDPSKNNPALIVQSVDFGRMLVLSMSSNYDEKTMELAIHAAFNAWTTSGAAGLDQKTSTVLSSSTLQGYVIGGDPTSAAGLIGSATTGQGLAAVQHWVESGAVYSPKTSPAAMISYRVRYLADGSPAGAYYETDWTETNCTDPRPIPIDGVGVAFHTGKDNSKGDGMQALLRIDINRGGWVLWADAYPGWGTKWEEQSYSPSPTGYFPVTLHGQQATLEDCPNMRFIFGEQDPKGEGNTTGWNTTVALAFHFENAWHEVRSFGDPNEYKLGDATGDKHMTEDITQSVTCP